MTTIETERLVIRNFRESDWEALLEMIVQYEHSDVAAYDHQWPTSPEEIKSVAGWFASGDCFWAVCLKDTDRLIGFVALNPEQPEAGPVFNLGYCFNFDYHGQGYATESCQAAIDHAFNQLQAQRVITGTAAANRPSCRLLERLGLQITGESTGSFRSTLEGTPIEFTGYTYAITREEWQVAGQHAVTA